MAAELRQQEQADELTDEQLDQVAGGLVSELYGALDALSDLGGNLGRRTVLAAFSANIDPWYVP
jgi:hypothetical protein